MIAFGIGFFCGAVVGVAIFALVIAGGDDEKRK